MKFVSSRSNNKTKIFQYNEIRIIYGERKLLLYHIYIHTFVSYKYYKYFPNYQVFCASFDQSHTKSITRDSNTHKATAFCNVSHNSSKNGYDYEQPKIQFNYPNAESKHKNYKALETINYLNYQSADSKLKPVSNVPMRLLLKIPMVYAGKSYKHEKDLRTPVEEREMRRPAARRLVRYTAVVTYTL